MKTVIQCFAAVCIIASTSLGGFDLEISGTYEYAVSIENSESLLVLGAGADQIEARDTSYVEVQATAPLQVHVGGIGVLLLHDSSTMNYYDGETGSLRIYENAQVVLQGGLIDYIRSYQYVLSPNQTYIPHIEIVSTEYDFDSSTNILTGVWMDDSTFDIQLVDQSGYDPVIENIFFTPEPATLLLVGAGGLLLRRRTKLR